MFVEYMNKRKPTKITKFLEIKLLERKIVRISFTKLQVGMAEEHSSVV